MGREESLSEVRSPCGGGRAPGVPEGEEVTGGGGRAAQGVGTVWTRSDDATEYLQGSACHALWLEGGRETGDGTLEAGDWVCVLDPGH